MPILPLAAAALLAVAPAHVALAFAPEHGLAPDVERAALAEAAAIWAPYHVVVTRPDSGQSPKDRHVVLTVVISTAPADPAAPWLAPLGAVDFDAGGMPGHVMTVFADRLLHMLDASRLSETPVEQWPRVRRDQLIGRAIGRVIAHEIGHVLLQSKAHAARGLMRAVQRADDLVDPGRSRYRLFS